MKRPKAAGLLLMTVLACGDPVGPLAGGTYELVSVDGSPLPVAWPDRAGPLTLVSEQLLIRGDRFERRRTIVDPANEGTRQEEVSAGDVVLDDEGRVALREDACHPDVLSICLPHDRAIEITGGLRVDALTGGSEIPRTLLYGAG